MFGQKLKSLREQQGDSQSELARKLHATQANVSSWERIEFPPLEAITKICKCYKVPLGVFFSTSHDEFIQLTDQEKDSILHERNFPVELRGLLVEAKIGVLAAYDLGRKSKI
jgi:transcriptional regulator with XRE-family HTH domain